MCANVGAEGPDGTCTVIPGTQVGSERGLESHMQELHYERDLVNSFVFMGYLVHDLSFIAGREQPQHRLSHVATRTRHPRAWHRLRSQLQLAVQLHHLVTLAAPQQHKWNDLPYPYPYGLP